MSERDALASRRNDAGDGLVAIERFAAFEVEEPRGRFRCALALASAQRVAQPAEEALRQRVEVSEMTGQVAELTANMNMDAVSIEADFPIFNEKSPEFDKAFADKVICRLAAVATFLMT